jgi:protein-disulfide isomerase
MASGKQSRRRRAAAAPPSPSRRGARSASPRVLLAVAGGIALVVVAAVLGLSLSGGSSEQGTSVPAEGSLTNALSSAAAVHTLFKGIPQSGNTLGSPGAPVTIATYVDVQCPYCRQFELDAMPKVIADYVRTGKAKVELRTIAFIGDDSVRGRNAVIAAGDQGKAFEFSHLLAVHQGAENTGWVDDDLITAVASSIPGLAVPKLLSDRDASATADEAAQLDAKAAEDAITATPTILVGRSGERLERVELTSPTDAAPVAAAIRSALG